MTTLTFLHALQVEVATLQAQHPILADAIDRAHALLLDGTVCPLEDGKSTVVGSSTDPPLSYTYCISSTNLIQVNPRLCRGTLKVCCQLLLSYYPLPAPWAAPEAHGSCG